MCALATFIPPLKGDMSTSRSDKSDYLDTPDSTPEAVQLMLPERRLWCEVINLNVQAALRGDSRSFFWVTNRNGGFVELAELLNLHRDTVTRIQQAVVERTAKRQSRGRGLSLNQHGTGDRKRNAPAPKPASAVPIPARPAAVAPWKALAPAPLPWKPLQPVSGDPALPDPTGWQSWLDWQPRNRRN